VRGCFNIFRCAHCRCFVDFFVFIVSHQKCSMMAFCEDFVQEKKKTLRALEQTMNPRPGPQRRNRSRLMAKLLERIKAGIIASDNNRLRDWGCVALTPPVEVALAVAAVLDVDVIDAGASAQGTVVAVWNTLGEPLTMEVQVVEMMAWDSSTTLLSPETPQSVEPSRAVFLTITTGSPSVTQTVRQPLFPTVVDLQATTSRSSSPAE
jgi:hypothetical protein